MDYNSLLNKRALALKPSGIRKYFDIVDTMKNVISLGVGEPDFQTPWHIRRAGIDSIEAGHTRYTSNWGLAELRHEIALYFSRRLGLVYDAESEIVVTVGGSEAIDLAIRAMVSPGDEVLIPEPSFVCYSPIVTLCCGRPVILETRIEDKFKLKKEELLSKITPKTKALILPYPNNPTGAVMTREDLAEIAEALKDTDIFIISDEIYSELTYVGTHASIASLDGMHERTVIVSGYSKCYSMTGWRLGYACGPKEILSLMTKIHQYAIMSAPTTAQYAAIEAMRNGDEDIVKMRSEYNIRRKMIVDGFCRIGLTCFEPEGAFYAFPSIQSTGLTSEAFCERLLFSQGVAVVPGTAFGKSGEGYIRASYCYSLKHIKAALSKIEVFLEDLA